MIMLKFITYVLLTYHVKSHLRMARFLLGEDPQRSFIAMRKLALKPSQLAINICVSMFLGAHLAQ